MGAGTVHGIRAYSLAFALVAVAGFASREALAGDDCHDGSCHASRSSCGSGGGGGYCGSRVSYSRYGDCGSRYGNWGRSARGHTYYPAWWGRRPLNYGVDRCDALAVRLGAPCAYEPRCGYRFHRGPRWASLVYDRRAYAWPSLVQADDAGDDVADESDDASPAVPLGPRAAAHEALFAGDAATAERGFRDLATADPTDAAAWIGVAHACLCKFDYAASAAALDKAAALGAISPTQRLDIPATYRDPVEFRQRFDALRLRVRWSVLDANARTVLAWLQAGTGESTESVAEARYVLRDRPTGACARVLAGLPAEVPAPAAATPAAAPVAKPEETATK